jgi:hypothetical protein
LKLKNLKAHVKFDEDGRAWNVIVWLRGNSVPIQAAIIILQKPTSFMGGYTLYFSGHNSCSPYGDKGGVLEISEIQAIAEKK